MDQSEDIYLAALRARAGDQYSLARLIDTMRGRLFSTAIEVTQNYSDAQDAVANAIVEICLHIGELQQPRGIAAWMKRIVRREALRLRRNRTAVALRGDEPVSRPYANPSALRVDVERALHQLPANHAAAIEMFYFDELSVREIADGMSLPNAPVNLDQVKTWLSRGRRQLAANMKGYGEMKSSPGKPISKQSALVCSDLPDELVSAVTKAMRDGGYLPTVIRPNDIPAFSPTRVQGIWSKEHVAQSNKLTDLFKKFDAIVFDEVIDRRSGLEYSLFCKSTSDTVRIPITLLYSTPADAVFIQACATVGIAHMIDKAGIASIQVAFRPSEANGLWERFSDDARRVIYFSQDEAKKLHENFISTEHLLLGLMHDPDCPGAAILDQQLGTSIVSVRSALAKYLKNGPGYNEALDMQLTPRSKRVIDLTLEEATRAGTPLVGSQHILLGLIAEFEGLAGRELTSLGIDLDTARRVIAEYPS